MSNYAFVLPFAMANDQAQILLAERTCIVRKKDGKAVSGTNPVDIIPEWAGQWGLIGDAVASGETPELAAERALLEQTGLDLGDADVVSNFLLANRRVVSLKTDDLTPFNVLCIFTTSTALDLIADAANSQIVGGTASTDLLQSIAVTAMDQARKKIGATTPPSSGWSGYLLKNFFGGKQPGALNTDQDLLATALTQSAQQDNAFFTTALAATE